jgi:hypothetical protein
MRLTSTGLVIGTTTATYKFNAQVDTATAYSAANTLSAAPIGWFNNASTTAGVAATIRLDAGVSGGNAATTISAVHTAAGSSALTFGTRSSGGDVAERARIDSSGNLGLGVTPSAWSGVSNVFQIKGNAYIASTTHVMNHTANAFFNGTNWIYTSTNFASQTEQVSGQHRWYTAASGTAGNAITFTQAMTLDASGNLLCGPTSYSATPASGIILGGPNIGTTGTLIVGHANGTATGSQYAIFNYNSGVIGSITQSGTTAVLYNTTSDQRLKQNIQDAAPASALIDAIQVRQYDWESDGSHQRYGFIAQELVTVAPEAVHQPADPEEMMAVDYSKLVPMLVKEIQSLRARVAALESN